MVLQLAQEQIYNGSVQTNLSLHWIIDALMVDLGCGCDELSSISKMGILSSQAAAKQAERLVLRRFGEGVRVLLSR